MEPYIELYCPHLLTCKIFYLKLMTVFGVTQKTTRRSVRVRRVSWALTIPNVCIVDVIISVWKRKSDVQGSKVQYSNWSVQHAPFPIITYPTRLSTSVLRLPSFWSVVSNQIEDKTVVFGGEVRSWTRFQCLDINIFRTLLHIVYFSKLGGCILALDASKGLAIMYGS